MGIFNKKNDNYNKAILGLKKFKENFDGFIIKFPDITSDEIMFIKNCWEVLPKNMGIGVKIMLLSLNDKVKTYLVSYKSKGYIKPHKHVTEYEIGEILEGSLYDSLTGKIYESGEVYKISPNENHRLQSLGDGCLVHSTLTTKDDYKYKKLKLKYVNSLKSV